jgi:hypothetical protein
MHDSPSSPRRSLAPAPPKQQQAKKAGAPKAKGAVRAKSGCYTCRIRRKVCHSTFSISLPALAHSLSSPLILLLLLPPHPAPTSIFFFLVPPPFRNVMSAQMQRAAVKLAFVSVSSASALAKNAQSGSRYASLFILCTVLCVRATNLTCGPSFSSRRTIMSPCSVRRSKIFWQLRA